eukprot:CAMPEP_0204592012 /NCGR_PEP_ID=MMETSP0661-20131031/50691_1 /ASSEMBLY_ACC=CAM_ASM_000606 /TAXON_ID=109239 /ORGANISM="Alexandrium margalefi, Strain AMGDE01CS-322" /LENGTH=84 /DNA_ID=CAMNT_0051602187 /DNA_START=35 /DNA_END=289 /DNA_ORIENTATION=-
MPWLVEVQPEQKARRKHPLELNRLQRSMQSWFCLCSGPPVAVYVLAAAAAAAGVAQASTGAEPHQRQSGALGASSIQVRGTEGA